MDRDDATTVRWRAWQLFLETSALLLAELDSRMQTRHGISLRRFDVLLQLENAPRRRMLMSGLADAVVISRSGLTGLVERMERDGLIVREAVPGDRRATSVRLSVEGRRLYRLARRSHEADVSELFSGNLRDAEARTLVKSLGRVQGRLQRRSTFRRRSRQSPT